MTVNANAKLSDLLSERYGEGFADVDDAARAPLLRSMAARGSCRKFRPGPVDPAVVRALCGVALASPTKSDLQQRDIVLIRDAGLKRRIAELVGGHLLKLVTEGRVTSQDMPPHVTSRFQPVIA